ncbi:MAG TPA: metal-dependent hydrolase [Bacillales bacterium]|nr:metal-dependent hydrolase [Bacillales bacterium]
MKATFHGHSFVTVETNGKTVLIDPFITGNGESDVSDPGDVKADAIILSHGHNDHVGDTIPIAKNNDALVIGLAEMATYMGWQGVNAHPMSIGGAYEFDFGKVKFTPAFHGSSYTEEENRKIIYLGMPAGILIEAEGKTIYHAGDTALFSDMKLIGERNDIDLAFIPIGDNFTMGPEDAAVAAEWINAKAVVPMHYNTFPPIKQDPHKFVDSLKGNGKVLNPGESIEL